MRNTRTIVMVTLVLAVAGVVVAEDQPCPSNFMGYSNLDVGASISCSCPAGAVSGSVWGSDRYTADSSICTAARHAGVVGAKGGKVTVFREGSCPQLVGSTHNGVTSRDWGPYQLTFAFKHPAPGCTPEPKAGEVPSCPSNMTGYEQRRTSDAFQCRCAAGQLTGSVWGVDLYTFDSSLCLAARHAGVIGGEGGEVTAFVAGPCASFSGSTRNGVTTAKWGAYDHTFAFSFPLPTCADGRPPGTR